MPQEALGPSSHRTRALLLILAVSVSSIIITACFTSFNNFTSLNAEIKSLDRKRSARAGAIDVVSLTVGGDFQVLFNNSAIDSWIRHIQNIRSITFIGPPNDEGAFRRNLEIHYPRLQLIDNSAPLGSNDGGSPPPIRWVNETHWKKKYMDGQKMPCPYWKVCQQLFKLHVFEIHTDLGLDLLDDVLIVDSDTVWSRDVTFVNGTDGRATYFEAEGMYPPQCGAHRGGDHPTNFTEAVTAGPPPPNASAGAIAAHVANATRSPYRTCEGPGRVGARGRGAHGGGLSHILHHMLFQRDVMEGLHAAAMSAWNASSLWAAFNICFQGHAHCRGRVAEYELYYAYAAERHPGRVRTEALRQGVDFMAASAICERGEMECCRSKRVLLKGCHDHRIRIWRKNPTMVEDMCCPYKPPPK